jgi:hypothetical protein
MKRVADWEPPERLGQDCRSFVLVPDRNGLHGAEAIEPFDRTQGRLLERLEPLELERGKYGVRLSGTIGTIGTTQRVKICDTFRQTSVI